MKRSERVAAVKISSVRRKAARKFWAPQQDHRPLRKRSKNFGKRAVGDAGPYGGLQEVRGERNPPVTALPCQPPLGKGAWGRGMRIATASVRTGFAMTEFFAWGAVDFLVVRRGGTLPLSHG